MRYDARDFLGGLSATLITIPSSIAFGLIIYSPMGEGFAAQGAMAGMLGAVALGIVASIFGGTSGLISAPCGPAAAVIAAFTAQLISLPETDPAKVPLFLSITTLLAGLIQVCIAGLKGGRLIKYIPYPVISGYLSGVGILLMLGQIPKVFGVSSLTALLDPGLWRLESLGIGAAATIAMVLSPVVTKRIPAAMISFCIGISAYWLTALVLPELRELSGNGILVGIQGADSKGLFWAGNMSGWGELGNTSREQIHLVLLTAGTLSILLSIDTLKTCVIVDALTDMRHDPNKELRGQGLGNMVSGILQGMAGAGTIGATLVNIGGGGRTKASGIIAGLLALAGFVAFRPLLSWIPIPVLAAILIVSGYRIIDWKSVRLCLQRSTALDFLVSISVVISAVVLNLIAASLIGVSLAILLFLRELTRVPVVAGRSLGNQTFSKRKRLPEEMKVLYDLGHQTVIYRLQGSLFFGTIEKLFSEMESSLRICRFLILDFKRVISIDFTAIHRLEQAARIMGNRGGTLMLTSLGDNTGGRRDMRSYMKELGLSSTGRVQLLEELDDALEAAEDGLLSDAGFSRRQNDIIEIKDLSLFIGMDREIVDTLSRYMKSITFKDKEAVFLAGEEGEEIFFIAKGSVRILLPMDRGGRHLLAVFGQGDFFGDMCFLEAGQRQQLEKETQKARRTADAVADGDVSIYLLTRDDFNRMARHYPAAAAVFYEKLARALSGRLRQTTTELKGLKEA